MLVFGDPRETADLRERIESLVAALDATATMPAGIDRHAKLVGALVQAGQLLQGAADAGLRITDELSVFVCALASAVVRSWDSRFAEMPALPTAPHVCTDAQVELKLPEGFAFYAVYPEAYVEAARRLRL